MATQERRGRKSPPAREQDLDLPLSALLSQTLVAFTIELDNEFERQMGEAGFPGARLSLIVWANLIRFLADGAVPARELASRALGPPERVKLQLGCLERWGFVALQTDPTVDRPALSGARKLTGREQRRDGWGSGRAIRADYLVSLTAKGLRAANTWRPLPALIERRWRARFGNEVIDRLRESLRAVVGKRDVELPHGFIGGRTAEWAESLPAPVTHATTDLPLSTLLSQALLMFTLKFDHEADAPLELSASVLRVLGKHPVRVGDLPQLTGGSPEKSAIGWELKPYVSLEADPTTMRGKVVRLTPRGLKAQQTYSQLVLEIEKRWEAKIGKSEVRRLRQSLEELLNRRDGERWLLSEGLIPPHGVARAGDQAPALGRRDVGAAARKRMRDLVIQTEAFVRDPVGSLPHYPLWDMNRGFGP
jgi:hypothetical protein